MQTANSGSIPVPGHDVTVEDLETEVCLYRPAVDEVLVLNGTASDIWRLLDGQADVDEVVQILARAYQVEPAQIEGDVRSTIADLAERGFVAWADAPGAADTLAVTDSEASTS